MEANINKCHFLSSININSNIELDHWCIQNSGTQKLLGITIDRKLTFNEHVSNLCKKASIKLSALARMFPYVKVDQRKTLMKAFFMSQFGYCPLVWMIHSRSLNSRINALHERALRLVYNDFVYNFCKKITLSQSIKKICMTLPLK